MTALIFFLTIWLVGQHDRNTYQIQLDHGGLSQEALVFKAKSSADIQTTLKKLQAKNWDNYQVQFIDPAHKKVSYIYAQHSKNSLSIINGRNFTASDFDSALPFAIVGQDYADQLYKPQSQAYLVNYDRYIPVIGQVGTSGNSPLNKHRFITVSPKQSVNKMALKNLQVIADGSLVKQHKQAFSQLVRSKSAKTYVPQTQNEVYHRRWGSNVMLWLIYGLTFVVLTVITWIFYMTFRRFLQENHLDLNLSLKMKLGFLRQFVTHFVVSALIGYLLGIWQTYLISYDLTTYYLLGVTIYSIILMAIFILKTKSKKNLDKTGA